MKNGRTTVYTKHTNNEKLVQCNPDNIELQNDFLDYLSSVDRSPLTIKNYKNDLEIFWCWNLEYNKNKYFVDLSKREIAKFQNHALNEWGWSSNRIRRVKSVLSSMSNFIENIMDDEIPNFKPIIRKIENPVKETVREKTVLDDEQVEYLLNTLVEKEMYQQACAVALAVYSGARKRELPRFKVCYFNDENIIYDAMYKTPEKIKTKGRSAKYGKQLTKYVLLDFKKYFDLWMKKREELGIDSEWLLVSRDENGEYIQMKVSTLDSYAETCSRILELPFYFHSLRHNLTTTMVSKYNLPSSIIQEYFGWNDPSMIYVYSDAKASDEFGKYFGSDGIKKVENVSLSDL